MWLWLLHALSMELPCSTVRSRGRCSPTMPSMPSPTECTRPPGPPPRCRPFLIAAFRAGAKIIFSFAMRSTFPCETLRRRMPSPSATSSPRLRRGPGSRCAVTSSIGFARRVATYKRADLLLTDPERLVRCAEKFRGLQVLFSGKAHPHDEPGKRLIQEIFETAARLDSDALKIVYLENYEWKIASMLTAGVDLWLNTPRRPFEASGTSGMKAALNGVPSLSVLDGWWIEGWIEGVTGWAIPDSDTPEQEVASLYQQLEGTILPLYYGNPEQWRTVMRSTIALNGSFFNTHRMLQEYISNAYYPDRGASVSSAALESALVK